MKLDKKLKADVNGVYDTYWKGLLSADIPTYTHVLDESFRLIGTTESEVFFKSIEAIEFLKATADQLTGNIELRNRFILMEPLDSLVLITEQSDTYVKIDGEWTYYGKVRCSSILEKKAEEWKFIHMHLSFPDSKANDGETIGLEKITKENLELRDAIKRRTVELENKNRELEIETALEKVRSIAMGMSKPEDLPNVCEVLFKELQTLCFAELRNAMVNIHNDEKRTFVNYDFSDEIGKSITPLFYDIHPVIKKQIKQIRSADDAFSETVFKGKDLESWKAFRKSRGEKEDKRIKNSSALYYYFYSIGTGSIGVSTFSAIPEEKQEVLKRFRNVFAFAYRRYMDVAHAEAQAREAQIELALERVRARTMAMQHSEELQGTSLILFEQLKELGEPAEQCTIGIIKESEGVVEISATLHGKNMQQTFKHKLDEPIVMTKMFKSWKDQQKTLVLEIKEEELQKYNQYRNELVGKETFPVKLLPGERWIIHIAYFSKGMLALSTNEPRPADSLQLLERFAIVFEQTYIRFLDLQKAEAQAREAQIEAALERVRSKTMAMHNSEDVSDTIATLFDELVKLGVHTNRCGIIIHKEDKMQVEVWTSKSNPTGKANLIIGQLYLTIHPMLEGIYHSWKNKELVFKYTMMGDDLKSYYQAINNTKYYPIQFDLDALPSKEFHTDFNFAEGSIFVFTAEAIKDEAVSIFKRFAKVFGQTYRRYLDLQRAEAQTHKANIETALERVRARALAMQQPEELTEVAQVMRQEMGLLGVEELETSSIYIHDDASDNAECWYAIKDIRMPEKKLVADHFVLILKDTWVGKQMFAFYHSNKKQISIPMHGVNRKEWINYCSKQSKLLDGFYGEVIPDRTYHLYKFSNGTIGAATPGNISAESWDLLQRAASVFSLAYSRFKDLTQARIDLQKLKEEKQRAEDALTELQATQKQLIQSEKMASLGELTAGIAHEIQNPLNFVNNFSEVSNELMVEMVDEVDKGNYDEVKAIAMDVQQNLEKINHHGKRASSIVKGMLEHCRNSTGKKELTDITALADEYMRLAYHGLRAKDKDFNATLETNFDPTLPKINVVSQDIGRVILNLITNAFYAVSEKSKVESQKHENNYTPTVSITTRLTANSQLLIAIKDNGSGIQKDIVDKIFQPFFTTKPTGQGTGLGLSLAYDIVKAHGGELKVDSKEGEGSEFVIQLPFV